MKKRIILMALISLLTIIISTVIIVIFFNPFLSIKLKGQKNITIEVNSQYKEKGVKISGTKNKYRIIGKVNTKKLGTYELTYKITSLKTAKTVKRKIKVIDTIKPEITLVGSEVTIYVNEEYKEPGYSATDNYDKDITSKVTINNNINNKQTGEYIITYTVNDSSNNSFSIDRKVIVKEKIISTNSNSNITYINGILLVNKKYSLPSNYNPGVNTTAYNALKQLQQGASSAGYSIPLISGFRSYSTQKTLYSNYVNRDGQAIADTYSARPGHSEHQTGLAFDIGAIDNNYGNTPAGQWLAENAHKYGFIIRYPKGKEAITGYQYEPWHIRYLGMEHATKIYQAGITLEEYLGVN